MQITEIYRSLQGESSFAGLPCVFVRLTGCNLRCSWCDSEYTFTGGRRMSAEEIEAEVHRLAPPSSAGKDVAGGKLVEITGGEPMLQERELLPFMQRLVDQGYTVLLETSGERPLANVPKAVHKIVDVKCPHSGAAATFHLENLAALSERDELKFVISDRADYEFARKFVREHVVRQHQPRVKEVLFSPAFRKDARGQRSAEQCLLDPQVLAQWMLEDGLEARLGLQLHKFIWAPETKGV
ncbi:MAG: radical SAM protein [Acidobacteriota bacterium]|nr:radical SAM protein [Acidobacteriota bacterium]